jgi:hypothetical protein
MSSAIVQQNFGEHLALEHSFVLAGGALPKNPDKLCRSRVAFLIVSLLL